MNTLTKKHLARARQKPLLSIHLKSTSSSKDTPKLDGSSPQQQPLPWGLCGCISERENPSRAPSALCPSQQSGVAAPFGLLGTTCPFHQSPSPRGRALPTHLCRKPLASVHQSLKPARSPVTVLLNFLPDTECRLILWSSQESIFRDTIFFTFLTML